MQLQLSGATKLETTFLHRQEHIKNLNLTKNKRN